VKWRPGAIRRHPKDRSIDDLIAALNRKVELLRAAVVKSF
jgi:hypothetical protein